MISGHRSVAPDTNGSNGRHRVLVLGGAGYVGSVLARVLLARGHSVTVMDALVYGDEGIGALRDHPGFDVIRADLRDTDAIARVSRLVDDVVHLGGLVGDPACALDEALTLEINLEATRTTAQAAKGAGAGRFIFASSCAVYGASDELLDEGSALEPVSIYARSKAESEELLMALAGDGFSPIVLRFGTFYGPSPRPRFDLVVNLLTAKAVSEGEIRILGGEQWRPFVHVQDGATAIARCLEAPVEATGSEIFNVGSDEQNYTLKQIARTIEELIPEVRVIYEPPAATEANYRVSFSKIRDRLGFTPSRTLADGIAEIQATLESGAIPDFLETRYSNHLSLTTGGAAEILRGAEQSLGAASTAVEGSVVR